MALMCDSNNPPRGRGRGRGGFNNQSNRGGFQQDGGTTDSGLEVQIRGWDGAENRNDVIAFLLRKFGVQVQNPRFQGQFLYCTAPNAAAYQTLINASGVRFAGKSLQVQPSQNRPTFQGQGGFSNQHTKSTYEILKAFLSTRYKADIGLLDLSNLASDETLQGAGFFQSATTQQKVPQG
jgi:RNA recognition motif